MFSLLRKLISHDGLIHAVRPERLDTDRVALCEETYEDDEYDLLYTKYELDYVNTPCKVNCLRCYANAK